MFNDTGVVEVRPRRSHATVMRILAEVVKQNRALSVTSGIRSNPGMLDEALARCDRLANHDCLVCIISDGAGRGEETRRLLTRIARHNDVLFAFVHDPLEGQIPAAGPLIFGDGLTQLEVDTGQRDIRERYREDFEQTRAAGRKFLLQRDTPVIPLSTVGGVAEQIRDHLGYHRR